MDVRLGDLIIDFSFMCIGPMGSCPFSDDDACLHRRCDGCVTYKVMRRI